MSITALDIIKRSLRILGARGSGYTPTGDEGQESLGVLNEIIDQWSTEKLMVYNMLNSTFSAVLGTGTYAIGASQTWNTTRPTKIETAFVRYSSGGVNCDTELEIINNAEYESIQQKTTQGMAERLNYVPSYPAGSIRLYPVPDAAYTISLSMWQQLAQFTALSTAVSLPKGYQMALEYALAAELALEYGKDPGVFEAKAMDKIAKIKSLNMQPYYLRCDDSGLSRRSTFNIKLG